MNSNGIIANVALATASFAVIASMALAGTTTVDDLQGLRPDTQGVETNAFWDTRAHLAYTVQSSLGASTNAIDTAFSTVAVSNTGDPGAVCGTVLTFR